MSGFFDMGSDNHFNSLRVWWPLAGETKKIEWPPWLIAPVHYQQTRIFDGVDCGSGQSWQAERVLIPGIPGYRIVKQHDGFYYVKV